MSDKSGKKPIDTGRELPADRAHSSAGISTKHHEEVLTESISTKHHIDTLQDREAQKRGEETRIVGKSELSDHSQKDDTSADDQS